MRIRADEHVATTIVRSVNEICGQDLTADIELSSIFDEHHHGSPDEYWVTEFAKKGGNAILTADKDFFQKPNQIVAIHRTRLNVFHLPRPWANARGHLQAAHILMWWPRIAAKMREGKQGEIWIVPWNIRETGELKQKTFDYQAAYRKIKRTSRRT